MTLHFFQLSLSCLFNFKTYFLPLEGRNNYLFILKKEPCLALLNKYIFPKIHIEAMFLRRLFEKSSKFAHNNKTDPLKLRIC